MDKSIHATCILGGYVLGDIEILDLTGKLDRKGGRIETGDGSDTRNAGNDVLPALFDAVADRGNQAQASDDDSATCQDMHSES